MPIAAEIKRLPTVRLHWPLLWLALSCRVLTTPLWSQSPPLINSFTASAAVTNPGLVTKLSWSVANATAITIDQGVGDVTGISAIYVSPVQTTTYTLIASAGSLSISQQVTVNVVDTPPPVFGNGRTYYVSPSGSDSNSGSSASSPWQTVAKVNATSLQPGDTVLFQRGGEWHESLTAPTSGAAGNPIAFADYGSGVKPKFWGSNILANSLFVPAGNGLYTYSIATPVTAALVNHTFLLTSPSGNAAGLVNSWSYSGTTLTINSPNSDPRVDGKLYTAVVRQDAVYSNYQNHLVFRNLVVDETAAANQGYGFRVQNSTDVLLDSCEAYHAGKHHFASINSTQFVGVNLYAAWSMPGQSRVGATNVDPAVSAYVSFGDYTSSLPNQTSVWRNCVWDHPVDPQNPVNYYAFYTHGSNITSVLLDNMSSLGASLTVNNSDNPSAAITVKNGLIQNARLEAYGQSVLVDGLHIIGPYGSLRMGGTNSTFQNILLEGSYLEADGYQSAAVSLAGGNTLRFSTIVLDSRASQAFSCLTLDSNFSGASGQGAHFKYYGNICITPLLAVKQWDLYSAAADFTQIQYNLYPAVAAFAQASSAGGFNNLTFAQWQALGMDIGSVQGNPLFVSAAQGNYNLQPGSPAIDAAPLPVSLLTGNPPIPTDQAGNPRLAGASFDIGALEYQGTQVPPGWSISAVGGTPQSTTVNTGFASALLAKVIDSSGNPVVGVPVTFSAPAGGVSATFSGLASVTLLTDGNGIATSAALIAGSQQGSYTVTAAVRGAATAASFSLTNNALAAGGTLSGTATSVAATANLTTEGVADWVHWGDTVLNRKSGVSSLIANYTVVGSGPVLTYNNDPRLLTWNDGTPTAGGSNANGVYINSLHNGFSVSAPADTAARVLTIHAGGWFSGGTLTAHLSDGSAPDYVDTTTPAGGQYDRNYTLTYKAASSGQILTVTWVMSSGSGNVTLNGAALSQSGPFISATAGTPQTASVNTAFSALLQASVKDANNNPLSGVSVTFTAPAAGAGAAFGSSSTATALTNASGVATAPTLTANGQSGSYTVTASATGVAGNAAFVLTNSSLSTGTGSLSGSGNSSVAAVNLTLEGSADWVHWGDTVLNRKSGVSPVISNYTTLGSGPVNSYNNDPRPLSWTDGAPTASGGNNNGLYISFQHNGFSFSVPADTTTRVLTIHAGGWFSGGTLTAHISDSSAPDYVDTTTPANGQYDRNYVLTYNAASAGQTLTISWVMSSGSGNVTLNGAALSQSGPSVSATAGTPQSTAVNTTFATALQATVRDASNNPLNGVTVTFTAPSNGAAAVFNGSATAIATTNVNGVATAPALTANSQTGGYTVTAAVPGVAAPATFSLTNIAGTPASVSATAGTPQTTVVNTAFSTALQATVRDASNNPLNGVTVTFTAPASGVAAAFNGSATAIATSNVNGVATAPALTANGQTGGYTVTAAVLGVSAPATFSLTNISGTPASVSAIAGTPQSTAVNTAFSTSLQATVKDASNNPLNGVTVTFTAPANGAAAAFNGSATAIATTNVNGVATAPALTANSQTGGYTVTAAVPGVAAPATFSLTNIAGSPASVSATAGTPQTTAVNTAFSTALQAAVRDASNNPLNGVTVTFTAPANGAAAAFNGSATAIATTNVNGIATAPALTANSQTGGYIVTAAVPGVAAPATFSLTNTAGTPVSVSATAGTPQTTAVNTAFTTALQATVRDASNNPTNGATVTFTAPANGAAAAFNGSATAIATTNVNGIATAPTLTANSQAGGYAVTAVVAGVSGSAGFALTNNATSSPSAVGLVQQAAAANLGNNQNTLAVTLANPPGSTSVLLLIFDQVSASQTITSITGATWTRLAQNYTSNNGDSEIWVGSNPTSSSITITGTNYFGLFQPGYAIVAEFTGITTALDGAALNATSGGWPAATGSLTTGNAADLLITSTLCYSGGGVSATVPSPWVPLAPPSGTYSLTAAYQIVKATGAYSAAWNGIGSPRVSTIILAVKATGSAN